MDQIERLLEDVKDQNKQQNELLASISASIKSLLYTFYLFVHDETLRIRPYSSYLTTSRLFLK